MKRLFLSIALLTSIPLYAHKDLPPLTKDDIPEIMEELNMMFIDRFCMELKKHYMRGKSLKRAFRDAYKEA